MRRANSVSRHAAKGAQAPQSMAHSGGIVICGRQAVFDDESGLVGFGHMSGLLARRFCPLALMKSDGLGP
jgi:hypothetical protein